MDIIRVKELNDHQFLNIWLKVIKDELKLIYKNNDRELMKLPNGRKDIRWKWVLRRKFKTEGSLKRYKVRLMVIRYTQQLGLDFMSAYSLVAKFTSVRIIMTIFT